MSHNNALKLTITFFLLIGVNSLFAQSRKVYFLKNDGSLTSSKESADYIRIVTAPDSGAKLYNVIELYNNGKRRLTGKSASADEFIPEGNIIRYYSNGVKQAVENYTNGRLDGERYEYFPNGTLHKLLIFKAADIKDDASADLFNYLIVTCNDSTGKSLVADKNGNYSGKDDNFSYINQFNDLNVTGAVKNGKRHGEWKGADANSKMTYTEVYNNGILKSGASTDASGEVHKYSKRLTTPQYPGGDRFLGAFISENLKYPPYARERRISGIVSVGFMVSKDGALSDFGILKSVDESLDKEAISVMTLSKKWLPAKYFGIPVEIAYNIPINFNISFNFTH